jgi:hypothetical protein
MNGFLFFSCDNARGEKVCVTAGFHVNALGLSMTAVEFKKKWARYTGKETSAYQAHFDDLCRLLGQPTPTEADPSGSDFFCYQKRVVKDLELFQLQDTPDEGDPEERGFADVWKKGCFAWEYKGKKKNLDAAYKQLLRYRESLLNPPLLVVCDFDRYIVRTNFNGTVQETYEFINNQIDRPENLRILRALFETPDLLKPQRTTAQVTERLAQQIAQVARLLQSRESVELADARTRAEVTVAQKKNLRIARFLNRFVFCFFAEDTGLLPRNLLTDILKASLHDPKNLTEVVEQLFRVMATGGLYGPHRIRHFNGHLFQDSTVFELSEEEIAKLLEAAEADWQFIQPSIMGNLFERGLDPDQRAQLGAHYTSETDILTLVEPVLMSPLRREWAKLKGGFARAYVKGQGTKRDREKLTTFLKKLSSITVLDPACGSGNFLYVALRLLLDLEKEVITFATQLGFKCEPKVSVHQLKAIELNAYAFELAQVSVQIGYLQWRRDNGFGNDRTPVLQNLDGFHNEDALLVPHFHSKAKTLREAQAAEHKSDDALKFYTERKWPKGDVIVSNPPFLGDKLMRSELGDGYVEELRRIYGGRIPGQSDFCCYWFEKAREEIESANCMRAGLLATQGIRGGASREVLKRIKETGDIFFAESDREWVLAGATVHVSMVGFDNGNERQRQLDGKHVLTISPQLAARLDVSVAKTLESSCGVSFMGITPSGPFDITASEALQMLCSPNPNGLPSSDVLRPWINGEEITDRWRGGWIVDFTGITSESEASGYESPFERVKETVVAARKGYKTGGKLFWKFERPRPAMRLAFANCWRFIGRSMVGKHQCYRWLRREYLPANLVIAFSRQDDLFFGLLHSRIHGTWALAQGTQLREKESGFRYTPTTCFETFPLPRPTPAQAEAIAAAARELNEMRERWLNPAEWTTECTLEFPGSADGPWAYYVVNSNKNGIGIVRYPRLEPRDADCAQKLKKRTLTNLYNERPAWLDLVHKKLDAAVAAAYGWSVELTDEQVLERLLALNLERAAEEEEAANVKPAQTSRAKRDDELV